MDGALGDVIRRVSEAGPKLTMPNHEGYYRHQDVTALVVALGVYDAAMKQIVRTCQDQTINHEDALELIEYLAKNSNS